ncbi:hypothetical protein ASE14_13165 [Agromyces sp. Root81]|uniref:hypothetical protein n=1 Tax=Agromyces sp. Root81 TaxID=1736601 RepID=UPI0007002CAD|nr:hypothetical protein [Agromyces sp. Root81]KRC61762.1 hypothetical protein ASE14_13165 [Agromyces sp. Root81]
MATTARAPRRRRLVGSPLFWAAACLALAVPWAIAGQVTELIPYLFMLVGGWLCGFSFVNATFRITPERRAVIVHVIGAIASAALVVTAAELGGSLLADAPEPVRIALVIVQFAAIPAAGWIWLALIGRVSAAVGTSRKPAPTTPEWVRAEHGHGSEVRFAAVPVPMRTLTTVIVVIAVVLSAIVAVALIFVGDIVFALGARLTIIIVGVVFALPAYSAGRAVARRHTLACTVGFGNDRLWIGTGSTTTVVLFRDLERLVWRCRSDYARIEVLGTGVDVSLVTGIAPPPPGATAELPALPRRVLGRLQDEGFVLERARRGEVLTFRRAG